MKKIKKVVVIVFQMILWHTTTNGGTMLHHGMGEGKISDHSQNQGILLFEQDLITPEGNSEFLFESRNRENITTTGEIIEFKFEADRNNSWSSGVSDGNNDPLSPFFGDYDPYDPGLDPD